MKSKKSLYILIPMVLGVWGIIIFRVLDMTRVPATEKTFEFIIANNTDSLILEKPKKLLLNYSDPFLRMLPKAEKDRENAGAISLFNNDPEPERKEIIWPEIKYQGIIENENKKVAILKIDEAKFLVSKSQIFNGMTVKMIYKDSIAIEKNREVKTFYK